LRRFIGAFLIAEFPPHTRLPPPFFRCPLFLLFFPGVGRPCQASATVMSFWSCRSAMILSTSCLSFHPETRLSPPQWFPFISSKGQRRRQAAQEKVFEKLLPRTFHSAAILQSPVFSPLFLSPRPLPPPKDQSQAKAAPAPPARKSGFSFRASGAKSSFRPYNS